MSLNKEINRATGWSIGLSVLLIVAGTLAIIVPLASGIALTIMVGWLRGFSGCAQGSSRNAFYAQRLTEIKARVGSRPSTGSTT